MNKYIVSVRSLALALPMLASCAREPTAVSSDVEGVPDGTPGSSATFGTIVVEDIGPLGISYPEPSDGWCVRPNTLALSNESWDPDGVMLSMNIPFAESPIGLFDVEGHRVSGVSGGEVTSDGVSFGIVHQGVAWMAEQGTISVELTEARDRATLTFTNVRFHVLDGDSFVASEVVAVPVTVGCGVLASAPSGEDTDRDAERDCGWVPDYHPYGAFCAEATAGYPEGSLE